MGLLDGLLGNASEIDLAKLGNEFAPVLIPGEGLEKAFRLIRDLVVFTNKRLIMVNKQGLTGTKVEYHSLPYRSITHFSIESAGHFDLDAELKVWMSGLHEPFEFKVAKGTNVLDLQRILATHILK